MKLEGRNKVHRTILKNGLILAAGLALLGGCRKDDSIEKWRKRKLGEAKELSTKLKNEADAFRLCQPKMTGDAQIVTSGTVGGVNNTDRKNTDFATDSSLQPEQLLSSCNDFTYEVLGYDLLDKDSYASVGVIGEIDKASCTLRITKAGEYAKIAVKTVMSGFKTGDAGKTVEDDVAVCVQSRYGYKLL